VSSRSKTHRRIGGAIQDFELLNGVLVGLEHTAAAAASVIVFDPVDHKDVMVFLFSVVINALIVKRAAGGIQGPYETRRRRAENKRLQGRQLALIAHDFWRQEEPPLL
jgi:hypothetical protein